VEEAPTSPPGGKPRRRWLGRLAALAFGLTLVCLAEVILQLVDYGGPTAFFVKVPEGREAESYITNFLALRSTFGSNPIIRASGAYPAPPPQRFPAQKDEGTYRIFVMGGSAAMGYPHRANGALPNFLRLILNTVCAGRRTEVVNLGVAAVNSYSLLERIGEVPDYGTDMVVVYCGNNEFYGAYGAGSAIPLSTRRPVTLCQMWLRRRRLSMALGDLMGSLLPSPPESALDTQLVNIMPKRDDIRYGDELYERVRANYEANLRDIVLATRREGLPIVLCTLGVNLRDFPPLGSLHAPDFPPGSWVEWQEHVAAAEQPTEAEDMDALHEQRRHLQAAADLAPGHAETRYRLARCLDRLGLYEEAARQYDAARDLDTVRWRAGSDFNDVVLATCRGAHDQAVVLADVAGYLTEHARDGIPGAELFLEHVHATLKGNFLIAEAVARAISGSPLAKDLGPWDWARHEPYEHYLAQCGAGELDQIITLRKVLGIYDEGLSRWAPTEEQQKLLLSRIGELQAGLTDAQRAAWAGARQAAKSESGLDYDLLHMLLVKEYGDRGQFKEALQEVDRLRRYGTWQLDNPRYAGLFLTEANIHMRRGDAASAARAARKALALDPGRPGALQMLSEACAALGDEPEARRWAEQARRARRDAG
jgi:tetratricopeptide (TPR) repeat protein